jgi:hypothetical protein
MTIAEQKVLEAIERGITRYSDLEKEFDWKVRNIILDLENRGFIKESFPTGWMHEVLTFEGRMALAAQRQMKPG